MHSTDTKTFVADQGALGRRCGITRTDHKCAATADISALRYACLEFKLSFKLVESYVVRASCSQPNHRRPPSPLLTGRITLSSFSTTNELCLKLEGNLSSLVMVLAERSACAEPRDATRTDLFFRCVTDLSIDCFLQRNIPRGVYCPLLHCWRPQGLSLVGNMLNSDAIH